MGVNVFACMKNYTAQHGGIPKAIRGNLSTMMLYNTFSSNVLKTIMEAISDQIWQRRDPDMSVRVELATYIGTFVSCYVGVSVFVFNIRTYKCSYSKHGPIRLRFRGRENDDKSMLFQAGVKEGAKIMIVELTAYREQQAELQAAQEQEAAVQRQQAAAGSHDC